MPNAIKYSTIGDTLSLKKGNIFFGVGDVGKGPSSATTYYNGVTPSGGGYTIYSYNASQTSNLSFHTAVSDAALITYTNGVSGQNFTTAIQCLNWYATQSNYVCVNKDYEGITTNGLVLNVDAGFIPSYPTNGTTWYDLSYGGNNGSLVNGPTYSSDGGGSIVFDSTDDEVNTSYGPTLGDFTIGIWFKDNGSPEYGRLVDKSYTGGFWLGRQSSTPNTWGGGIKETSYPYGIFLSLTDGQWNYLVSIRSGSSHILYGNGITNTTSNTVTSSSLDSTTFSIGAWSGDEISQRFKGNIGVVQVYNRALSSTEVLQNYNAGLSRFNTLNIVKSGLQLNLDSSNEVSYPSSGTLWRDLSGNGNSSNGIGSPTFDTTTKSFQFDATDDRFYTSISKPFDMYCLEITFKPHKQISSNVAPDNNAYSLLGVRRTIGNNNGINVYEWTGTMTNETVSIWSHDGYATGIVNTVTNDFHTMTFNWNGSTYDIWLDGQQLSTIQRASGHAQLLTNVTDVDPGYNAGYGYYHKGNIAVVRAYNRSLSSTEILQNYYKAPIVTSGLVMALDAGNLVSYSGSGTTWKDLTSIGANGTLTNGPTFSSSNGGTIVFDGIDDYMVVPTFSSKPTTAITCESWIKPTKPTVSGTIRGGAISSSNSMYLGIIDSVDGGNTFAMHWANQTNNSRVYNWNGSIPNNSWSYLVGTYDGTTARAYLNGVEIWSTPQTGTIPDATYYVGTYGGTVVDGTHNFNGSIPTARIYNRALTPDEIFQNYNATKSRFGL